MAKKDYQVLENTKSNQLSADMPLNNTDSIIFIIRTGWVLTCSDPVWESLVADWGYSAQHTRTHPTRLPCQLHLWLEASNDDPDLWVAPNEDWVCRIHWVCPGWQLDRSYCFRQYRNMQHCLCNLSAIGWVHEGSPLNWRSIFSCSSDPCWYHQP